MYWTVNREVGVQNPARAEISLEISAPSAPLANSAMSALTAHCRWDEETLKERIGHQPSYVEAKKMKSLTLHTHGYHRAGLIELLFFFYMCLGVSIYQALEIKLVLRGVKIIWIWVGF